MDLRGAESGLDVATPPNFLRCSGQARKRAGNALPQTFVFFHYRPEMRQAEVCGAAVFARVNLLANGYPCEGTDQQRELWHSGPFVVFDIESTTPLRTTTLLSPATTPRLK